MSRILECIQEFILFSDFSDLLPFEVEISAAAGNSACRDFAKVAGFDLKKLSDMGDLQKRRNYLAKYSAILSDELARSWGQDGVEIIAEPDGASIRFGVKDKDATSLYRAEQRSRGFQWFLSFFLRLQAEGADGSVILIDEPGLYLHARAQRDVLAVLERLAIEGQVIF